MPTEQELAAAVVQRAAELWCTPVVGEGSTRLHLLPVGAPPGVERVPCCKHSSAVRIDHRPQQVHRRTMGSGDALRYEHRPATVTEMATMELCGQCVRRATRLVQAGQTDTWE